MKTRQIDVTQVSVLVTGTAVTPAATGMDAKFIGSVTDNGTGDYTIAVAAGQKAQADLVPVGIVSVTPGVTAAVTAVSEDSLTVECLNNTGAPIDADIYVTFLHRKYGTNL